MKLINIGYGNIVSAHRVVAVVKPESAPSRRLREEARDRGKLIDATSGHKARSLIVTDSDHIVLSGVQADTLRQRIAVLEAE